ncbi:MAG: hypothetical protein PHF18_01970 [Methanosarcina sp.]|uniref:hypothetical protein n=1 Tax=Methanosarcina sp. TaxID=2213 RepID=UPI002602BC3B|nr:hypothetical protein [Methanosarcina sp.]MDD3245630.1 hypothetical protein [Methanosarcina sp.]MDD4248847.1 hypothetical protein [Methanosarcina sp.]
MAFPDERGALSDCLSDCGLPAGLLPPEEGLSADALPVYGLPDCDFSTTISTHPIDKYETPLRSDLCPGYVHPESSQLLLTLYIWFRILPSYQTF